MGFDVTKQNATDRLPPALVADLNELDQAELRAVRDYVAERLASRRPSIADKIEPAPGEDMVDVIEHGSSTLVVKRQPCADGCEDCPHGPHLYRVRREVPPSGNTELHWSYLGTVGARGERG